jgi:magnesium chelatase family protein
MAIDGLADKSVAESKERVRAALSSLGLALPSKRIAINLSPADVLKEGAHFDLPIAVALLVAMGVLPEDSVQDCLILGELSLNGSLQPVSGVLSAALAASASDRRLICPAACGGEAAWAGTIDVIAPNDLTSLLNHLRGAQILSPPRPHVEPDQTTPLDMADLKGQETARRALEIAAAGRHNLLMIGPPGAGKSMLAARLPGLLPALDAREALEVTMLHSVAGQLSAGGLIQQRPFREPHHSASMAALVGGGARAKPGEISLAHNGVLFLDELAEFSRPVLDALRQPLETGQVVVARANRHVTYPARFQLVAAMNPCRCGYMGDPARACSRAPQCGRNYSARISGPMMDRFDIIIEVPEVSGQLLFSTKPAEASSTIAARIAKAADFAKSHDGLMDDIGENDPSDMTQDFGKCLSADAAELLRLAVEKRQLSARGFYKVIRVARTIANLGQSKQVGREELAEALAYRMMPLLAMAPRFLSMASQVRLAIFTPEREVISRMPVGEVTLISVR